VVTAQPQINFEPLREALAGDVVAPSDNGWDEARQAWNLIADQRPEVVVQAATTDDIAVTVRFATANGLRVAAQATGHGAISMGALEGAILLRTARLTGVRVDPIRLTARVEAGTPWRDVVAAAGDHGLVCLHGMSGGVGVAGYTLGGGIGWLSRREGFASTHVRSLEVVTAEGRDLQVDAEQHPDLFWALRGGGGSPVIVKSLVLKLFPLREAFAGALLWPIERAQTIVPAYREWIATAPDTVTSTLKLIRFPPLPELPDALRGRALAAITLASTRREDEGNALVAPLRAAGAPYLDTLAAVPAPALADISGDPQDPLPGIGKAVLLDALTPEAVEAYVELAGPEADTPLTALEIRHLGAALARPASDPGAAGRLSSEVLVYGVGNAPTPEAATAIRAALDTVGDRFAPWVSPRRTLLTFAEQGDGLRNAFMPQAADRLARVAATYDPDGVFVANHAID
jgi:FAD/FMN-containing dehydrogenase